MGKRELSATEKRWWSIGRGRFHIGKRTLKTAAAVVISMAIVNAYGSTTSKLVFAMLGAMTAMENTFRESLRSCLTQIVGVFFGAMVAGLLIEFQVPHLVCAGIGIVLVITLYNMLRLRLSPTLPCLIVVTMCTTPDILPMTYALGRLWDTVIGLGVGILINTLIFPYDNSRKIHAQALAMEEELVGFLEDLFDGDNHLPNTEKMNTAVDNMSRQLIVFANQWLPLHGKRRRREYTSFRDFWKKARQMTSQMEVLCRMDYPGALTEENRRRMEESGIVIRDKREIEVMGEREMVTNYHVSRLLDLRSELHKTIKEPRISGAKGQKKK